MPPKKKTKTMPWSKERKGDFWSEEEEEFLDIAFDTFLSQQAIKHKRTKTAILCSTLSFE